MYRFEKIVGGMLSIFRQTQMWDNVPTVVPLVEKIMERVVSQIQAENGKNTTINLLSYSTLYHSVLLARRSFVLLSNYISYFPYFLIFFLLVVLLSLEMPLLTLMREIASTINSTQFNITGLQEQMQLAIEHTLRTMHQVRLFPPWCHSQSNSPIYNLFIPVCLHGRKGI